MAQTILVPLDGSKRAEAILPHVEKLAGCYPARVALVSVVEPVIAPVTSEVILYADDLTERQAEITAYLDGIAASLREKGIEVETRVTLGQAVRGIIEMAQQMDADLIAMTSHGRTGLAHLFYGSVAIGVLHSVDRPLLLVRSLGPD